MAHCAPREPAPWAWHRAPSRARTTSFASGAETLARRLSGCSEEATLQCRPVDRQAWAWWRACWRGRGGQGAGPPEAQRPSLGATCPALDAQHSGLEHVAHQATRAACRGSDEFEVEHQDRDDWPLDSAAPEPRGVFAAIYWPSGRVRSSSRPLRRALPLYFGFGDGHAALRSPLRGHCGQMLRLLL